MSVRHPIQLHEQVLHVYVSVNYIPDSSVGIAITQEHRDHRDGKVLRHWTLNENRTRAWRYRDFARQDVQTLEACQLRAFREALGMIRGFYGRTWRTELNIPVHDNGHASRKERRKRAAYRTRILDLLKNCKHEIKLPHRVVISCGQRFVVDLINNYLRRKDNGWKAISCEIARTKSILTEDEVKKEDKLRELHKILATLKSIRRVRGAQISVIKSNPRDGGAIGAKRLAREKRIKVCGGAGASTEGCLRRRQNLAYSI